jgi:hypothetical protein
MYSNTVLQLYLVKLILKVHSRNNLLLSKWRSLNNNNNNHNDTIYSTNDCQCSTGVQNLRSLIVLPEGSSRNRDKSSKLDCKSVISDLRRNSLTELTSIEFPENSKKEKRFMENHSCHCVT